MVAAGTLDRRLTLWRQVETGRTYLNEPVLEWQEIRKLWAAKVDKANNETFLEQAQQRIATSTLVFRVRFFDDLRVTDCLECEDVEYDVIGWQEIGRRDALEITCEAVK